MLFVCQTLLCGLSVFVLTTACAALFPKINKCAAEPDSYFPKNRQMKIYSSIAMIAVTIAILQQGCDGTPEYKEQPQRQGTSEQPILTWKGGPISEKNIAEFHEALLQASLKDRKKKHLLQEQAQVVSFEDDVRQENPGINVVNRQGWRTKLHDQVEIEDTFENGIDSASGKVLVEEIPSDTDTKNDTYMNGHVAVIKETPIVNVPTSVTQVVQALNPPTDNVVEDERKGIAKEISNVCLLSFSCNLVTLIGLLF
jgi:hypothetical protein